MNTEIKFFRGAEELGWRNIPTDDPDLAGEIMLTDCGSRLYVRYRWPQMEDLYERRHWWQKKRLHMDKRQANMILAERRMQTIQRAMEALYVVVRNHNVEEERKARERNRWEEIVIPFKFPVYFSIGDLEFRRVQSGIIVRNKREAHGDIVWLDQARTNDLIEWLKDQW